MRSSLWIAASAAALICFGQTAGAQTAKQDDKGGGAVQRSEMRGDTGGAGRSGHDAGAASEKKSGEMKGGGSAGSAEGGKGAASERSQGSSPQKGAASEKSKRDRQGAENGQAAGASGKDRGADKADSSGKNGAKDKSQAKSDDDSKRGGKSASDERKNGDQKSKSADRKPDDGKSKADAADKSKAAGSDNGKAATNEQSRDKSDRNGGASTGAATGTGGTERDQKGSAAQDRRGEGRVQISQQQRTTVHDRVLKSTNVNRVTRVNITINVGTRVPRSVHLAKLPADVIEIVPQYRSYEYFVTEDRICIVEPSTYEIVEVIDAGGPRAATAVKSGSGLTLTPHEREIVLRTVDVRDGARGQPIPREGVELPSRIEVHTFPRATLREVPKLDRYRYFAAEGSIVIVDPRDERVELIVGNK